MPLPPSPAPMLLNRCRMLLAVCLHRPVSHPAPPPPSTSLSQPLRMELLSGSLPSTWSVRKQLAQSTSLVAYLPHRLSELAPICQGFEFTRSLMRLDGRTIFATSTKAPPIWPRKTPPKLRWKCCRKRQLPTPESSTSTTMEPLSSLIVTPSSPTNVQSQFRRPTTHEACSLKSLPTSKSFMTTP